jgi:hypothetical protein
MEIAFFHTYKILFHDAGKIIIRSQSYSPLFHFRDTEERTVVVPSVVLHGASSAIRRAIGVLQH